MRWTVANGGEEGQSLLANEVLLVAASDDAGGWPEMVADAPSCGDVGGWLRRRGKLAPMAATKGGAMAESNRRKGIINY